MRGNIANTVFSTGMTRPIEHHGNIWLTFLTDERPNRRRPLVRIVMSKASYEAWRMQLGFATTTPRLCGTALCPLEQPLFTRQ
jgi:hypothetical protein